MLGMKSLDETSFGARSKYIDQSRQLSSYETLQQTLELFKLVPKVESIEGSIQQIHDKQDAIIGLLEKLLESSNFDDGYKTPSEAMEYLSMCQNTFDKYRYSTKIKIKGYQLDGKTWYKKCDLDKFMLTYQAKSGFLS